MVITGRSGRAADRQSGRRGAAAAGGVCGEHRAGPASACAASASTIIIAAPTAGSIDLGLSVAALPLPDGSRGHLYTFQDVTDVKRFEQNARLQQRLAAVGEMAAGIAHEIRNPLASMSGSMQMLKQELPLSGDQAQLMDIVLRESERLNQTIKSFLAYARPQRFSAPAARPAPAGPRDRDAAAQQHRRRRAPHASRCEQSETPVMIDADEGQIRQIIWNLATNGLRAMPEGGTLTPERACTKWRARALAVLRVEDEGVGIAPEEIDAIFQPFRGSFGKGTGLGPGHRPPHRHRLRRPHRRPAAAGPRHHVPRHVSGVRGPARGAPGVMRKPVDREPAQSRRRARAGRGPARRSRAS